MRQYGLIGTLRVYKKEVCVIESKPDNVQIDDLRIANPFPELLVRDHTSINRLLRTQLTSISSTAQSIVTSPTT